MPVCKKCGCFTSDPNVCLNCGAPRVQNEAPKEAEVKKAPVPEEEMVVLPEKEPKQPKDKKQPKHGGDRLDFGGSHPRYGDDEPKKKRKGPIVALIIILCVLIAAGGVAAYFLFFKGKDESKRDSFDCNCAQLTEKLNRLLVADGNEILLSASNWKPDKADSTFVYSGNGFTMRAETEKEDDVDSDILELRAGPTANEQGQKMATLCVLALEQGADRDTVIRDMGDVKQLHKDKMSYSTVAFTYDGQKDEFVLVPSSGAKSVPAVPATSDEAYGATPDSAQPSSQTKSDFVCGSGFIKAGNSYLFSNGERIFKRDEITDNNTGIIEVKNDGQLLSDGKTVFYVEEGEDDLKICSVGIDGSNQQTLLTLTDKVYLIHVYGNTLYYVAEAPDATEEFRFKKLDLDSKLSSDIENAEFDPRRVLVSGDKMYCSKSLHSAEDINSTSVFCYSFATGEFTEAVKNAVVTGYGYFNGAGSPCIESYKVKDDGSVSEHFLYTEENGKLKKSSAVSADARLETASPTAAKALLCSTDDAGKKNKCWLFDFQTGKCSQIAELSDSKLYMSAMFDVSVPETIAVIYEPKGSDEETAGKLYMLENNELKEAYLEDDFGIGYGNYYIADGYLVDGDFDAHKIVIGSKPASDESEENTEADNAADAAAVDEGL